MNYTGKICDGCRQPLENADDIVVCPICGTPQHRSCYEKNNRCVNDYLHSTDFTWTDPDEDKKSEEADLRIQPENQEQSQAVFSPTTPQNMESVFLRNVLYDPKDDIGGATVGEAADFIQNSASRYISKFMKQKKHKRKISWNWAAFFFSPYWFFYRKLYKVGAVFLALSVALTLATVSQSEKIYSIYEKLTSIQTEISTLAGKDDISDEDNQKIETLYNEASAYMKAATPPLLRILLFQKLIPNIIAALVANYFLKKRMLKVINFARGSSDEPNSIKYTIMRNGGVSVLMPIIAIMIDNYLPNLLFSIANKINF